MPRQQPARPVPEGAAVPWHRQGDGSVPGERSGTGGESLIPPPPSSAVQGVCGGVSAHCGLAPSPGTGLRLHRGAPNPFVPGGHMAPARSAPPHPSSSSSSPHPSSSSSSCPLAPPAAAGPPPPSPHPASHPALSPPSQSREQSSAGGSAGGVAAPASPKHQLFAPPRSITGVGAAGSLPPIGCRPPLYSRRQSKAAAVCASLGAARGSRSAEPLRTRRHRSASGREQHLSARRQETSSFPSRPLRPVLA